MNYIRRVILNWFAPRIVELESELQRVRQDLVAAKKAADAAEGRARSAAQARDRSETRLHTAQERCYRAIIHGLPGAILAEAQEYAETRKMPWPTNGQWGE